MSAFATKIDVCLSMAGSHTVKNIADIFQSVKLGNISGYFFDAPLFFCFVCDSSCRRAVGKRVGG